jgi:DNA-binding SARP family transcriptional activator/WD40 repeat protein
MERTPDETDETSVADVVIARDVAEQAPNGRRRPSGASLQFRILGALEVGRSDESIALGGPQQRAVLAHLIVRVNELVPTDVLVDEIWGDEAPESARSTIYTYVSHLRKQLGASRIEGRTPGYRLRLDPSELDAARFDKLVNDARKAAAINQGIAATVLDEALGLWRGPALGDIAGDGALRAEAARLDELRLVASEERIDALLAIGEPARVIGEAELLVGEHPLRERVWGQLMLALYREGRQAEAMGAYQRVREILADELGVDPSPELVRLHERILRQDPGLELRGEPLRGYRLLEKIDSGRTGVVFRAIQPHVGRDVAVKIVHEEIASDPAYVRRFDREAQAAASLEHPHIVPIYDYWREPGRAYIVSRYLKGGSLAALGTRDDRIPPDHASLVVEHVASALAFAHRQGVAHGHVHASNVLFDGEGNAYLGDFRIGVGPDPDPAGDVREMAVIARDVLGDSMPPRLRALVDQTQLASEAPGAEAFVDAVRGIDEADPIEAARPTEVRNPYKGLRPFTEADAHDFFGRAELTSRLLARLDETGRGARFLAVVGPSGAGKSSVVRAGMVPQIRHGAIGDAEANFVVEMFPGVHPIDELEQALVRVGTHQASRLHDVLDRDSRGLLEAVDLVLPSAETLVLVVDQFEEAFTLTADERERELFLESLRVAAVDPDSRVRVVVTLRADFYDRPLTYPRFGELLAARTEAVPPLTPDELEQAIRRPAEGVGITAEPGLVAEVIADVAHQPGALPLLQFALTELFERREGERLTLQAFEQIGGTGGALSARADRLFAPTEPEGQQAIRQVFLRLVTIGEGRQDTRRRVAGSELDALDVDPDLVQTVLDTYGRHRLLTFDREPATREPTVEIAHEALLTAWGRLRTWIDDAREDLRQDRRLSRAAGEWRGSGRDPSFVVRGARLEQVEAWIESTDLAIGANEREFVKASVDVRERETAEDRARRGREERTERRSRSRLRALVVVLAIGLVVAGILAAIAMTQRERADNEASRAEREARNARSRALAAAAVANLEGDPELSVLLAMRSVEETRPVDGTVLPESEDALHQAIGASHIDLTLPGIGGSVAWARTGLVAAESAEGKGIVEIVDPRTGMRLLSLDAHDGAVTGLTFSRGGETLATTGDDGTLKLWDPSTGDLLHSTRARGVATDPAFAADGSRVAAVWRDDVTSVRVVRVFTGRVIRSTRVPQGVMAFDPDVRRVAVSGEASDGSSTIVDLRTGRRREIGNGGDVLSWSLDGRYLAAGSYIYGGVFDATGRTLFELNHGEVIHALGWSQGRGCHAGVDLTEATCLVTGGTLTAKVWAIDHQAIGPRTMDTTRAEEVISVPPRLAGPITGVALSPSGRQLITTDAERTAVKIWDVSVSGDAEVANFPGVWFYSDVAFMPDGVRIARMYGEPRSVALWDLNAGRTVQHLGPSWRDLWGRGKLWTIAHPQLKVSPDGTSIATFGVGGAQLWDVASGNKLADLSEEPYVSTLDWSVDGRHLIIADRGRRARIVDRAGAEVQVLREDKGYRIEGVHFSPDGRLVAMGAVSGGAITGAPARTTIWDLEREVVLTTIDGVGHEQLAFSPDGARIVTASTEGPATVWDVGSGERLGELQGNISHVTFSPDGATIAASLEDATLRLYDAQTYEQQLVLRVDEGRSPWIDFSPDSSMLVSGDGYAKMRVWALDIDDLLEIARREVTRSLTKEECRQYLRLDRCPAP